MIKCLFVLILVGVSACSSVVASDSSKLVAPVFDSPESFEGQRLHIQGTLKIDELGNLYLADADRPADKNRYLDLVFEKGKDVVTLDMDSKCVIVDAIFRAYSSDFVGLGWMTSKAGLLRANEIHLCAE